MARRTLASLWLALVFVCSIARADDPPTIDADFVLKGGEVHTGFHVPANVADVAVRGDRIAAVGAFKAGPKAKIIDVSGRIVAPGFIDLHTHADETVVKDRTRANLNYLMQGVTTVVTGNCGAGPIDIRKYFAAIAAEGCGTNVIHLIPQGEVRRAVLGTSDREASADELDRMRAIVAREMDEGAWGMSTGLIYVPGRYARTDELIALARVVADRGGFYATHVRDEEDGLLDSIEEAIRIGREAKLHVHISHLKANLKSNWGRAAEAIKAIETAIKRRQAITADQYPYVASSTRLSAMVVPEWARRGDADAFSRLADDPREGPKLREFIERELKRRDDGRALRIARFRGDPKLNGLNLKEIAERSRTTPLEVVLDIMRRGDAQAIHFGMSEDDVRFIMKRGFVATASDGAGVDLEGSDRPHPRAFGTFPRKIRYALEYHVLPLENAIASMTVLPAQILGLPDRGVIRVGAIADLVVFDPQTFRDAATFEDPKRYPTGIEHVFVNGSHAIDRGEPTNKLAGRPLRRTTDGPADSILHFRSVWTGDPELPSADTIALRRDRIVAVGARSELVPFAGLKTEYHSYPHGQALPGLIDAHVHLSELGATLEDLDLRGVDRIEKIAELVKKRIEETPGNGWIVGRDWDQTLWPSGEFPDSSSLDSIAGDRPVWLRRVDGHAGWADSSAMRLAKIDDRTPDPAGGRILRDKKGRPTGVFIDAAMSLVDREIPAPSLSDLKRRILRAQERAIAQGVTAIHDAGLSVEEIEAYRSLDAEGKLILRVYGMALPPKGREVEFASEPPPLDRPGGKFRLRALKIFMDGALGSRGALMFEPYDDDPQNSGLSLIDPTVLERTTEAALRGGWQVCVHAIGDKGIALTLDAFEKALKAVPEAKDPRLRIEHAQVVRKEDVSRFATLGIIASMQPSHATDDMRWAEARIGRERGRGAYAWRWFADAGVRLAFGSDAPVEPINPFLGLHAAVSRQNDKGDPPGGWHPEQKLGWDEALRFQTAGSAFAGFQEREIGKIRAGMKADLIGILGDLKRQVPVKPRVELVVIDGVVRLKKQSPVANRSK